MAKAVWNGQTLAESEKTETVEGNVYFPEESVKREFLKASSTTSSCPWKGQARYYTIIVDGQENPDAAWYYPDPKPAARNVKHHVAFWRGVEDAGADGGIDAGVVVTHFNERHGAIELCDESQTSHIIHAF